MLNIRLELCVIESLYKVKTYFRTYSLLRQMWSTISAPRPVKLPVFLHDPNGPRSRASLAQATPYQTPAHPQLVARQILMSSSTKSCANSCRSNQDYFWGQVHLKVVSLIINVPWPSSLGPPFSDQKTLYSVKQTCLMKNQNYELIRSPFSFK